VRGYGKLFPIVLSNINKNTNDHSDHDNDNSDHNNNNNNNDKKYIKNDNSLISYDLNNVFELLITTASTHMNRYIRESVYNFIRILCDPFIRILDENGIGEGYDNSNDINETQKLLEKMEITVKIPLKNTDFRRNDIIEYDANLSGIIVEALVIGIHVYVYIYIYILIYLYMHMYMYINI
jgi:hypothetical protein